MAFSQVSKGRLKTKSACHGLAQKRNTDFEHLERDFKQNPTNISSFCLAGKPPVNRQEELRASARSKSWRQNRELATLFVQQKKQRPIGYGVGLRIKRSSVRIRLRPLRCVLGQGSLLPLSQGEALHISFY